jgi:hypothetical protein
MNMHNRSKISKLKWVSLLGGVAVVCTGIIVPTTTRAADKVDFVKDVQPILEHSCVSCHGGNDKEGKAKIKGKFNFLTKESAMKGGENGAKDIVAGKAEDSLVYKLLLGPVGTGDDQIDRMPKGKKAEPLPADKIKIIKAWIDGGAEWPEGVKLNPDAH